MRYAYPFLATAFALALLFSIPLSLAGQGSGLPLGSPAYDILTRLEIKTGLPAPFHTSLKYYQRGDVAAFAMGADTASVSLSAADRRDLYYLFKDNNEWLVTSRYPTRIAGPRELIYSDTLQTQVEASMADPRYIMREKPYLGFLYPTPANMLEVNQKFFHLRVNPLLNLQLAKAKGDGELVFQNLRGIELRAGIDDRIFVHFNILETQSRFPDYVNERIHQDGAIPGAGYYKSYKSEIFDITDGYDYLNGQGYLAFNLSRHVGLQFGYGRNFIGNGYRSLILSDFANNYLYLKANWRVWKLHYQNIFAELAAESNINVPEDEVLPKKYMAAHYLSYDVLPNLSFGIFETVMFSRENGGFELQYLNPVILYRTIEQGLGSPDNVLIGFDANWNFLRHFQLYGQVMLDEFKFKELFLDPNGWWANKFGIQGGAKYINAFGVEHLDLQAEFNLVRPYTYTHRDSTASFTHYNQPLAHPLGANFKEALLIARYQPFKRLFFEGRFIRASFGEDGPGENWGGNLLLSHLHRQRDYGNTIGQGIGATTSLMGLDVSYMLAHNLFVDLNFFHRKKDSEDDKLSLTTRYFGGGLRLNVARQRMDF
ncbi:MAG: hypothetical protein KDC66_08475 [Phaeodactylibacter sp.]|nr:hypothetical protein [Phaeodactylibacter sp.]MCB9273490.1 hypothetical protein [Lewinellaceae bacterium]